MIGTVTLIRQGKDFLPEYTIKQLRSLYARETRARPKVRLLAAILRKEGKRLNDIAFVVQTRYQTVSCWLQRLAEEGIEGLVDKPRSGRKPRLSAEERAELVQALQKPPTAQGIPFRIWTTKLVQYFMNEQWSVFYKLRQVWNILRKEGFVLKKPRPRHYKANVQAQEDFKKKFKRQFRSTLLVDSRSFAWMKHTSPYNRT